MIAFEKIITDDSIDKLNKLIEATKALRIEKHKNGYPFMLYYDSGQNLNYLEYANGSIEIKNGSNGSLIKIITGKIADDIRKKAGL